MFAFRQATNGTTTEAPPASSGARASAPPARPERLATEGSGQPSEAHAYRAGDVVDGRYVLIEPLGKGGMGVVWKARSTALDVEVAVKLVRSSRSSSDAFKRMAREAHAAARLGHPAMATVLDFGATPEGDPYVVMELLHGESLGEVLGRERRVEPLRAVGLLLPIIDCLREAHDKGIVHRDIKPENLFIAKAARGRVQPKVLDFGIAKLEQPFGSDTRLTRDGAVLGSPGYFSPEQARGQSDIDFKTDIWSICVVLYELVTGELPFHGANYNALLMSILKDAPAPITTYGYGDAELWRILQRGLSRDRDKRWASMGELGRALATWLHARGVHADITCRSLEDVWLDPRAASEAPPLAEGFEPEVVKRRVLSTLVKRRVDTLAGETVANSSPRRLPTRVIGWAAGALGLALIVGSLVRSPRPQGVPISTSAAPNTAPAVIPPPPPSPEPSAAVLAAPAQAPQASTPAPPTARGATPTPSPSPRAAQGTSAGAQRSTAAARTASSTRSTPDKPTSERTAARAATSATSGDATAKPQRTTSAQPVRPKAPKPSAHKAIDQEFGF